MKDRAGSVYLLSRPVTGLNARQEMLFEPIGHKHHDYCKILDYDSNRLH